ncbi:MAG: hypothetical protein AABZ47_04040 [Planctomycetota bacterium]
MKRSQSILWIIVGLVLNAARAVAQIPEGWEIKEIFPAGTEYYCSGVDINERGQVVFSRRLWPSFTDNEVLLYDRGKLVQLTDDDTFDAFPRLNNRGEIAWARINEAGTGNDIILWRDGQWGYFVPAPYPQNGVDINDSGQIVWDAVTDLKNEQVQVMFFDGTTIQQITDDEFVNQGPRINNHGDFVFERDNFFVDPFVFDIIAHLSGNLLTLSDGLQQAFSPQINDRKEVAWSAFANYRYSLWFWQAGSAVRLFENVSSGLINNRSEILFSRSDQSGYSSWIFRDGKVRQVLGEPYVAHGRSFNTRAEIAFQFGDFPEIGIALLTKPSYVADLDFDGDVDLADFAIFQNCFGESLTWIAEACSTSDINNDAVVDYSDVTRFVHFLGGPEFFEEPFTTPIRSEHIERNTVGKLALGATLALGGIGTTALAQTCNPEIVNSWNAGGAPSPLWSNAANWNIVGEQPRPPSDCDNVFISIPALSVMDRPSAGVPRRRVLSVTMSQPGETRLGAAFELNNSELYCVRDLIRTNSFDDHVMQLGQIDQVFVGDPAPVSPNLPGHGDTYGFQWFIDGGASGASVYVTDTIGCGRWTVADARIFAGFKPPNAGGQIIPTALGTIDPALCDTPAPEGGRIWDLRGVTLKAKRALNVNTWLVGDSLYRVSDLLFTEYLEVHDMMFEGSRGSALRVGREDSRSPPKEDEGLRITGRMTVKGTSDDEIGPRVYVSNLVLAPGAELRIGKGVNFDVDNIDGLPAERVPLGVIVEDGASLRYGPRKGAADRNASGRWSKTTTKQQIPSPGSN